MKKVFTILCSFAVLSLLFNTESFAGVTRISSIYLGASEATQEPGVPYTVEITNNSSYFEIVECEPSLPYDQWKPGKKITYSIELAPSDGYIFYKKDLDNGISISNMEIASTSISSSKVVIKANYYPKVRLANPTNLYYDLDDGDYIARWDEVEFCKKYEVEVYWQEEQESYYDDDEDSDVRYTTVTNTYTVESNKLDIGQSVTAEDSEVSFRVRAVPKNDKESVYVSPSEWVDSDDVATASVNTSYGKFSGTGDNMVFIKSDGTTASGWEYINDVWYYCDPDNANKVVVSAWKLINGNWYRFDENGKMLQGWVLIDKLWFCLTSGGDKAGAMRTGWVQEGPAGAWYYLATENDINYPFGAMVVNCITPDGHTVNEKGEWVK